MTMPGMTRSMKPIAMRSVTRMAVFRNGFQRFFRTAKAVRNSTGRNGATVNWVTMIAVMPEMADAATK